MSSIAYITDPNMLEFHRLNGHTTMNFWRLSTKISFKNFAPGDLVFFLSKDKKFTKNKEKGIVGYGKLQEIKVNSPSFMWRKYTTENGYKTQDEFKEALSKVSKNHKVPRTISSFYLTEVSFFQSPVYLSECGIKISNNIESFIYIEPEEVTLKLLSYTKNHLDMWFSANTKEDYVEKHEIMNALFMAHDKIKDINYSDKVQRKAYKFLKNFMIVNPEYEFMKNSKTELYTINDKKVTIVLYHEKNLDEKLVYGQAKAYEHYVSMYCPQVTELKFIVSNRDAIMQDVLDDSIKKTR